MEFWADFFLLQPVDPSKGNGRLLYDVHNRGNKLALWTFNDGEITNLPSSKEHAGNGFLFRRGFSLLWTGWNGDVMADGTNRLLAELPIARSRDGKTITGKNYVEISVDEKTFSQPFFGSPWGTSKAYPSVSLENQDAALTMRPNRKVPAVEVPRDQWAFADFEDGKVYPNPSSLYVKEGFQPGWIYELVYTAKDPRVSGLGLAGLRDAVSFFRYAQEGNPTKGMLDHAYIFGISQSGRLSHHFFYEGFNLDEREKKVFDGAIIHVPGAGKGLFNTRFGMATVYGTYRLGNLSPSEFFPFTPMMQEDPLTGKKGDTMAHLRNSGAVPKLFFVQSSTEYWSRAASLMHTDVEGTRDLELAPNVRIYSIAGTQHLGGGTMDKGICQFPRNPLKHRGPVLRALLVAMDDWVSEGSEPPPSRYPRIDDGTLVDLDTYREQFPAIPGVSIPPAYYQPLRLDMGPRWYSEGIVDQVPARAGKAYRTLVPAVDADGNELAGIRLPEVQVPLATYMGWNLRDEKYGAGGVLAGLHGGYLAFPRESDPNDPRPSIRERYTDHQAYMKQYSDAAKDLLKQGYLLEEDTTRMINEAMQLKHWQN